eukprot:GILJ01007819.1.p1 GENE.GILJ01007819.1~~GILJ01007819.1.p1  ORF type:complete len:226 (+),score=16.02 GILJ01007819.1:39-716(+)
MATNNPAPTPDVPKPEDPITPLDRSLPFKRILANTAVGGLLGGAVGSIYGEFVHQAGRQHFKQFGSRGLLIVGTYSTCLELFSKLMAERDSLTHLAAGATSGLMIASVNATESTISYPIRAMGTVAMLSFAGFFHYAYTNSMFFRHKLDTSLTWLKDIVPVRPLTEEDKERLEHTRLARRHAALGDDFAYMPNRKLAPLPPTPAQSSKDPKTQLKKEPSDETKRP